MKKISLVLAGILFVGLTACNDATSKISDDTEAAENTDNSSMEAQGEETVDPSMVDQEGTPQFKFEEEMHDFGTITEGTVAKHDFVFTNTGDAPLIITNAQGSCGCTVPQWPREPIAPGEQGKIHVEFNSQGRAGNQHKQVTLNANTPTGTKILRIQAQVEAKAQTGGEAQNG